MIKKFFKKILRLLRLYPLISFCLYFFKKSYLYQKGWFHSFQKDRPISLNGEPIPWLNYPVMDFLQNRINMDMSVFEYGSGMSTLWWAARTKKVFSVEHDKSWYDEVKSKMPDNVNLYYEALEPNGSYSKKAAECEKKFDIIIIDGRERVNCSINAINALKPEGVIIWDDTDRTSYKKGYDILLENGFKRIEFIGMKPLGLTPACTSIFYRSNNCLKI